MQPTEFQWDVHEDGVWIVRYTGNEEHLKVPEMLEHWKVTGLADGAMKGCDALRTLTIPESVSHIGNQVFMDCTNLESIQLPKHLDDTVLGLQLFTNCKKLKAVSIPQGVKQIGREAFDGCSNLEKIVLPDGVNGYGPRAFRGCDKLQSITLPAGISMLTGSSFEGSPLETYTASIQQCMSTQQPFVFEHGKAPEPVNVEKVGTSQTEDALLPSYALGDGLILDNQKRLLRRMSYDAAKGEHVFRDIMVGGTITVKVLETDLSGKADADLVCDTLQMMFGNTFPKDQIQVY